MHTHQQLEMISSMTPQIPNDPIARATEVLQTEAEGILNLIDQLDTRFTQMVELIYHTTGRLIVSGIGKSGIIGRKIVATLNSTGTRALFLHPVEALHGDLGMVGRDDIFLAISNSGETDELNLLLPSIRSIGCKIVAFTGKAKSTLALHSDIVIDVGVPREACPLGLAPTTSTTATLAMGDALAVVLIDKKKFNCDDFRKFHPGGSLGQRLAARVCDIMLTGEAVPQIAFHATMPEALQKLDQKCLGAVLVVDDNRMLKGIITDGDIRRLLVRGEPIQNLEISRVMTPDPRRVNPDCPVYDALHTMERYQITVLPITGSDAEVLGILHLHDILGKGKFQFNGNT